jgi:hypothetical protein
MYKMFFAEKGQKVTDKYLRQVLVTSICGILLCMCCFVGTSWAWYTVSVENTDNVIHIVSEAPEVSVTMAGNKIGLNEPNLPEGTHDLDIAYVDEEDNAQHKGTLYVTLSADRVIKGYVVLNNDNGYSTSVEVIGDKECFISWTVSWFAPDGAQPLANNLIVLPQFVMQDESTASTDATSVPTEVEPESGSEPSTQTDPVTETTQSTENKVESTEDNTQTTETETNSAEEET